MNTPRPFGAKRRPGGPGWKPGYLERGKNQKSPESPKTRLKEARILVGPSPKTGGKHKGPGGKNPL